MYVDDIVVTINDLDGRESLRRCLIKEFERKELGRLKYLLVLKLPIQSMKSSYHNKNTY